MNQNKEMGQEQPEERTLMLDGQPKCETALNITDNKRSDTPSSFVAAKCSADDSTDVDVKPVINDVNEGTDCPGTWAPTPTEASNTRLEEICEIAVKDEYECSDVSNTCNDKTTTDCADVQETSLCADQPELEPDEVTIVDDIREESTETEVSNTTSCHADHVGSSEISHDLLQNETTPSEKTCHETEIQTHVQTNVQDNGKIECLFIFTVLQSEQ